MWRDQRGQMAIRSASACSKPPSRQNGNCSCLHKALAPFLRKHKGSSHLHVVIAFEWSCICLQNRCWDVVHVCVCARILEQVLVVCAAYSTLIVYVCIIISIGERSSTSLHEACPKLARFWTRSSFQAQFPSKTKVWLKRPANSFERNSHWDQ